jgi:YbbR domain-containing protein
MTVELEKLLENLGWKLASLLIAIAIWLMVHTSIDTGASGPTALGESRSQKYHLPITVMRAASDIHAFLVRPDSVDVVVTGTPETLAQLQASDLQVFVDLVGVEQARELSKRIEIHLPPGVRLERMVPREVTVDRADASPQAPDNHP